MAQDEIEVRCEIRDDERVMIITLAANKPQDYQNFISAINHWLDNNRYFEVEQIEIH